MLALRQFQLQRCHQCGLCAQWQQASYVLHTMQDQVVAGSHYSQCHHQCLDEGFSMAPGFFCIFDAMPKAQVIRDAISYKLTITGCGESNHWAEALMLLDLMTKTQVTPDVISYTSAISACEKGGQWQVALTVFDAMARVKVVPSSITYNVTPCAVGNGGQWRKVLLLFEEMPNAMSCLQRS